MRLSAAGAATLHQAVVVQQNDPSELLEVFDSRGHPSGRARTRAQIHLDGDWHLAFHCWILRCAGREVVLQRRSLRKDTFGGCWDAAAAGHWRFGETPAEAAREIAEELGISVRFSDLVYRGRERSAKRFRNGLVDREWHEVYVLEDDRPLTDYGPDPREVIGLAAFDVADVIALAGRSTATVTARESVTVAPDGTVSAARVSVLRDDIVPYSAARLHRMLGTSHAR
jgi:isopentenyldiphosphate isomerase